MASIFQEAERERAQQLVATRSDLFDRSATGARFFGRPRPFVLQQPATNLFAPIRVTAVKYFSSNKISWWGGRGPTGHLLSSQIACLNHLFAIRDDAEAVTALLQGISGDLIEALPVPGDVGAPGYLQFEAVSDHQYLQEDSLERGALCTTLDVLAYARHRDGGRRLVGFAWKYTEHYSEAERFAEGPVRDRAAKKGDVRQLRYNPLVLASPQLGDSAAAAMATAGAAEVLTYKEPYAQLMRQTLLLEQMVEHRSQERKAAEDFLHVHVIPKGNGDLLDKRDPATGLTMPEQWRSQLRDPAKYLVMDPQDLLLPLKNLYGNAALLRYLQLRYAEASQPAQLPVAVPAPVG